MHVPNLYALHVALELLFSEELGLVLEVSQEDLQAVCQRYSDAGLHCHLIGRTCGFGPEAKVGFLGHQNEGLSLRWNEHTQETKVMISYLFLPPF